MNRVRSLPLNVWRMDRVVITNATEVGLEKIEEEASNSTVAIAEVVDW